jgi:hypothetical protein
MEIKILAFIKCVVVVNKKYYMIFIKNLQQKMDYQMFAKTA